MDKDVVLNKLESLRRCIRRVQDKTPESPDVLAEDYDCQDIIVLKRTVRIGTIAQQDDWRRSDLRALTPNQRVAMLLQMRNQYHADASHHLKRIARIRTNRVATL